MHNKGSFVSQVEDYKKLINTETVNRFISLTMVFCQESLIKVVATPCVPPSKVGVRSNVFMANYYLML